MEHPDLAEQHDTDPGSLPLGHVRSKRFEQGSISTQRIEPLTGLV
ncbi:hypothetical protein [Neorhizobium sp. T7_12]|nr:hypothetical protein [Neorhizobium sp. T7_12]